MYSVYSNPIGAARTERINLDSYEIANEIFEQSCEPLLYTDAYLCYIGPNPLFHPQVMFIIERQWHRGGNYGN